MMKDQTKKELKQSYKEKRFKIGLFQIKNTQNNKVFIDKSMDLESIWNRHKFQLKLGSHSNKGLQNEWKSFGEEHFEYAILTEIKQTENTSTDYTGELKDLLALYIDDLKPFGDKGYHTLKKEAL